MAFVLFRSAELGRAGWAAPTSGRRIWIGRLRTFNFVCFAWIFFRSPNLETAFAILSRIGSFTVGLANVSAGIALIMTIAVLAHYVPKRWYDFSLNLYIRAPFFAQAAALAALVVGLQYVVHTGATPFIYNKF
jgi:D-alanyl-lipoteichoic acid acyltransferase DltB (MBOAT superfamily)